VPTRDRRSIDAASRLRIVVLGYIVRGPLGGLAWHHLQYVMGLAALGHDVYFVEDSGDSQWCCYDPVRDVTDTDPSYGLQFAATAFARVGLGDRWAYYDAHRTRWCGPAADRGPRLCAAANVVLNVSGVNPLRPWLAGAPVRVLLDTDPAFTQIRHLTDPDARALAAQHNAFFSFAENIAQADCTVPADGLNWQPTRQPVVLDAWPVTAGPAHGKFTTVMQWDSYPARTYGGREYGMKSASFMPYLDLPQRVGPIFDIAIGSATAPRDLLRAHGWVVRDSREPTRDPWTYRRYIQESAAEFGVAKHGYVASRSGWFSERSAVYLASGRPVVTEDTGFSSWLETGSGLLRFTALEEATEAIVRVREDYARHCRAARAIAEQYFDAHAVLQRLIDAALASPPAAQRSGGAAAVHLSDRE